MTIFYFTRILLSTYGSQIFTLVTQYSIIQYFLFFLFFYQILLKTWDSPSWWYHQPHFVFIETPQQDMLLSQYNNLTIKNFKQFLLTGTTLMLPAPCTSENTLMTHRYAGLSLRAVSTSLVMIIQIQLSTENFSILSNFKYCKVHINIIIYITFTWTIWSTVFKGTLSFSKICNNN